MSAAAAAARAKDNVEDDEEEETDGEGDDGEGDDDDDADESKRTTNGDQNGDDDNDSGESDEGDEGDDDDEHDYDDVASAITAATGGVASETVASVAHPTGSSVMFDMPDEGESKYTTLRTTTHGLRSSEIGRTPLAYIPASPVLGDGDEDDMSGVPNSATSQDGKNGDDEKEVNFEVAAQFIIYPDDVIRTDLKKEWTKVPTEVFGIFEDTTVKDIVEVKLDDAAERKHKKDEDNIGSHTDETTLTDSERELSVKLILAADTGNYWEATRLLLIQHTIELPGPWINYCDPETGDSALMRAAQRGDLNLIQLLYAHCNVSSTGKRDFHVDHADYYGQTALIKASRAGHFCVVKFLLNEAKAKAFGVFDKDHWNALMHASARGHWHIVELLTVYCYQQKNADFQYEIIAARSQAGQNALMLAAANGYVNIVRFFLETTEYGAADKNSNKIMSINPANITSVVNSAGRAIPKFVDNQGMTPLWLAVKYGRLYVVHYLLSRGADPGLSPAELEAAQNKYEAQVCAQEALREEWVLTHTADWPPPVLPDIIAPDPRTAWTIPLDESVALRKPPVDRAMLGEAIKLGIKDFEDDSSRLTRHVKRPQKFRNFQDAVLRLAKAQRYLADAVVAAKMGQHESAWILTEHAERSTTEMLHLAQEIAIRDEAQKRKVERKTRWEAAEAEIAAKRRKLFKTLADSHLSLGVRYLDQGEFVPAGQCLDFAKWFAPQNAMIDKKLRELEAAKLKSKEPKNAVAQNKQERSCFSFFGL